jgi:hypothetical protein
MDTLVTETDSWDLEDEASGFITLSLDIDYFGMNLEEE